MSWKKLVAAHKVHTHKTSMQELDELRAVIQRDLSDASIPALSEDRRFATAYNAALQAAKMAIACAGYRVGAVPGHHAITFECAGLALGKKAEKIMAPMQPGDVPATYADIEASTRDLGFQPTTPIGVGIPKFIAWFKDYYGV